MAGIARSLGIPLVTVPLAKYECCVRVHAARAEEQRGGAA
jgi:hypothetical protein